MKAAGFAVVTVEAFPIVNASYTPGAWSMDMLEQFAEQAQDQGAVDQADCDAWLDDLRRKGSEGSYFFCVNRFLFTAVKC